MSSQARDVSDEAVDDIVLPYTVESLRRVAALVRLGPAIDAVLKRHNYPDAVNKVVGEAAALAVLLGSTLKSEGRFQLQTKSDGPLGMLRGRFRRAVEFPRAGAVRRQGGRGGRKRRSAGLGPSRLHRRDGRNRLALPRRDRAGRPGAGGGGARLFRAFRTDPDARPARGRPERDGGWLGLAGGRSARAVPAGFAGAAPAAPISTPATRPRA